MSISAIKKVAQGVYGASRFFLKKNGPTNEEIGRASCRERV